jgi:archaellum component FlaC
MVRRSELLPDERILPLSLAVKAMIGVESLRTRPSGMVSFDNADGTKTIIGGSGTDQIATNAGDTQAPSRPTGLSATSTMQVALVHWDGTLEYGMVDDFDHIEIFAQPDGGDVLDIGYMRTAGELATGRLPVGSVVELWAVAADNAHDLQGNPSPNMSDESDHLVVTIDEPVDQNQIRETAEKLQKAADDAAAKADEAIKHGEQIRQDAQAGIDDARKQAQAAGDKADKVRSGLQAEVDANKQATDAAIAKVDAKADKAQNDLESQTTALKSSIAAVDAKADQVKAAGGKLSQKVDADKAALDKSIADVDAKAQAASDKGDRLAGQISDVTTTVNGHTTKLGELSTRIEGVASDGQTTVKSLTSLQQTVTGLSSTVSQNTKTASDAMSKASQVEQTANGLSTRITAQGKTLDATTKTANEAKSTADSNKQTISQVKTTADGAVSRVSSLEQNLDGFESTVAKTYQPKDGMSAYATTSALKQTSDSITAQVAEVSKTASGAMSKATTVEQTANGLSTRITEQAKTLDATVKTANEAKSTADSNKTTISQTSNLVNAALAGDNLITDGGFESTAWWMGLKAPFRLSAGSFYHGAHVLVCDAATGDNRCPLTHAKGMAGTATAITVTKGRTYRLSGYCAWYGSVPSNVNPGAEKLRLAKPDGTYIADAQCGKSTSWAETHVDWKCPDDGSITSVRIEVIHQTNGTIMWDDVSFRDITEAAATSTRVASVAQDLNGFKTSVADTYQPKTGMGSYATQSQLTQTANQIRGEVSEKYQSKDGMSSYATNSALTQKANEITGKVQEVAKTTQGNTTTISQVSQKADKINTTLSQKIDGKADVSRVSSLEQNLSGFKTTVAQSYQPKGDYPTRSDMQSSISQTASSIKSEVANTCTTQTATEALRKSATRTFTIGGAAGKAKWVKLGYLTSNGDSSSILLHVYSGDGYNGRASQNAEFEIFVKDGWQQSTSATGAFGVSVSRIRDADDVKVKVMAFSSTTCNIWAYMPWTYWNGHYTLQGDYKSWQDGPNCGGTRIQDAEPTSGTAQNLAYDTLSTRSYVDQTAKSVALGVVQSYKGSDGSGLATKSDITVAKTSITSSVSSTYATKTGVTQEISSKITQNNNSLDVKFSTKTETKNAQDTANTANSHASDAQSRIGSLEDCINLTSQGVRVGKRVNGKWSGWSALVNTGGSYDIFDGAGAKQATFSSGRLDLGKSGHNTNGIYVPDGGNWTSGWLCIDDYLVDCDHTRHIYACARGGLLCFKGRVALTNPNAGGDQRVIDGGKWYQAMQGKYSVYPYLDVDDDERDWPVTFKRSDNNLLAVGTLFIPRTTRDIWWYDPTRGKHTMWIDLNNLQIPMGNNVIG